MTIVVCGKTCLLRGFVIACVLVGVVILHAAGLEAVLFHATDGTVTLWRYCSTRNGACQPTQDRGGLYWYDSSFHSFAASQGACAHGSTSLAAPSHCSHAAEGGKPPDAAREQQPQPRCLPRQRGSGADLMPHSAPLNILVDEQGPQSLCRFELRSNAFEPARP